MNLLYNKLKNYNLSDAILFESKDRQFLALKNLWEEMSKFSFQIEENKKNINNEFVYFSLIIGNSLVCYQLSGSGEDYWEEFSKYFSCLFSKNKQEKYFPEDIINLLINFLKICKNNKRLIEIKIKRLEKFKSFLEKLSGKEDNFYKNMLKLRDELAKTMNQKKDAKTIVFAVKMYSYGARNIFNFEYFPEELFIPIDSRLTNLFEKYSGDYTDIKKFYLDLAYKLNIPIMHLDGIIWTLYDEII